MSTLSPNRRPVREALLAVTALVMLSWPVFAQSVPTVMNYQGRLTDNSPEQIAINGSVMIDFRIYGSATGSDLLWSESWAGVQVVDGIFSVLLGSHGTPIPATLFGGGTVRYLEIEIEGEALAPRQQMGTAGWAAQAEKSFRADVADNVSCIGCVSSNDVQDNSLTTNDLATNSVGVNEIATDAVRADEIAPAAVGASEIAANAVGASEIAANAVGASEIATGAVTPVDLTVHSYTLVRSIGTSSSTTQSTAWNTFNFCALSKVQLVNMINSGTNSWCSVEQSGSSWRVTARSNGTTYVTCEMRCF